MRWRRALGGLCALSAAALIWFAAESTVTDLASKRDLHGAPHAGSEACQRCHPAHYESWHRSYHRTMTRDAATGDVLGDFDDATLDYFGVTAHMSRGLDGDHFRITFTAPQTSPRTVDVVRTVGSHRYQQYLAEEQGTLYRLPVAWHIGEQRWFHMNGAFLTPDPPVPAPGEAVAAEDYDRHVVSWADNCIFCHNTGANPGRDADGGFNPEVAELGIACEACHGPGEAHVAANSDPLRRYALHLGEGADPSIRNPARMSPARAADVCGRCHGQRKTDQIERFLEEGDAFVPGDDLALYSEPLWHDTTLDGRDAFALRFWPDGTPRLSAYELQGLIQSPCSVAGEMTCTSCHTMHGGDPAGQLRPDALDDASCEGCHSLSSDHGGHDEVSCLDCHMPRIVYGLIDVHRSHRVESPNAQRAELLGRPDACTLCHVDRSRRWAISQTEGGVALDDLGLSEVERAALGGDPIERAVAAHALGRSELGSPARRFAVVLEVMDADPYPGVRHIAWRAALRLADDAPADVGALLARYVPESMPRQRELLLEDLWAAWPEARQRALAPALAAQLRAQASQVAIEIGE